MTTQALTEARAMATTLHSAKTLADLDRLYVEWIGYSIVEDSPSETADSIRAILRDYIKEFCYSTGTHCSDVFPQ